MLIWMGRPEGPSRRAGESNREGVTAMRWARSLVIPLLTAAASAGLLVAYVATGRTPSDRVQGLIPTGLGLALVLWMMMDARARHRTPCYDFGFLVAVFFPVSLVWYVLWTRGWKGLLTLVGLIGLWFVPWLTAMAAWILRYGFP